MIGLTNKIELYKQTTGLSYRDAFLDFCDEKGLDPEEMILQINKTLKEKIASEFVEAGMVKGGRPDNTKIDDWFDE